MCSQLFRPVLQNPLLLPQRNEFSFKQLLKNILTLRRLGVPIAQIRGILDVLAPEDDVLASEKAVSLLKQHLDLLKNRQAELSQQIEKTSTALHGLVA